VLAGTVLLRLGDRIPDHPLAATGANAPHDAAPEAA
jgi:hypothetical protein